ncbi:MAG: papain-like cysteine protease family protein [Dongiaceae bacterium]
MGDRLSDSSLLDSFVPLEDDNAVPRRAKGLAGDEPLSGATGFAVQHQQQDNWCWAAVSSSVAGFLAAGSGWTQCKVVNAELGRGDCCGDSANGPCDTPWYLDAALTRVGCFRSMKAGPASFDDLREEVKARRVLCARIGWDGGGGHFVGITGWSIGTSGTQYLAIEDPFYSHADVTYQGFVSAYRNAGSWTHSYFTGSAGGAGAPPKALSPSRAARDPATLGG